MKAKRILVAPLDWGLGHATRCIPIIKALLGMRCEVFIAGSGSSLQVLKNEFPQLTSFSIVGYEPEYSTTSSLVWKMGRQMYKFFKTIRAEYMLIDILVEQNDIDIIISDNRFGCWSRRAKSIFITHQLNILLPKSIKWFEAGLRKFHDQQITHFNHCWIPDFDGDLSMAGDLSTSRNGALYIGSLSRFELPCPDRQVEYDVAILLSGPEPQRSILEKRIMDQAKSSHLRIVLVKGLIEKTSQQIDYGNLRVINFLNTEDMRKLICNSSLLIARSGYSTLMDLMALGGRAFFVPTPGQTEQEYLATRMEEKGIAGFSDQDSFNLLDAVEKSKPYKGFSSSFDSTLLTKALSDLMND